MRATAAPAPVVDTGNRFLGKSYTVSPSPSGSYPDSAPTPTIKKSTTASPTYASASTSTPPGGPELTNGTRGKGAADWTDYMGWTGAAGMTITIRVDAAAAVSGTKIRVWFHENSSSTIDPPSGIKVETSDNDSSWTTVEDRTGLSQTRSTGVGWLDVDVSAAGAHRYWRITLANASGNFVFIDEVELL